MARRSFSDVVSSMISFLRRLRPRVDTKEGTFTRDVVIDASSSEFDILYRSIENTSNAQSPDLAISQALTNLARNLQASRRGTIRATGTATFYRISAPPGTISIPRGTIVSSKGSLNVSPRQFTTTQDATLSILNFNADTARFEADVPVRAILGGADANVSAGAISVIVTVLPDIVGCYNIDAITGGRDKETDAECVLRVKQLYTGNNVGTGSGYYLTVMANPDVADVKVVGPSDTTIAKRATAGALDILIRGGLPTQAPVESYTYTTGAPYYIPAKQPLYASASGSFVLNGSITGLLVQGVNYSVSYDTSTLGGSIYAADKFVFIGGLINGEVITFTYSYNSLIENVQNEINADTAKIATADVLVKAARQRLINITTTIEIFAGYTADAVISDVRTALSTALNAYVIGEEVQQSDIIAVIAGVDGVDSVSIPLDTFEEDLATGGITQDTDGNLVIPADSYAASGTINVFVQS